MLGLIKMDVTRENFKEVLPAVKKAIDEASFIAIDAEFTGLSLQGREINGFDLPEDRYQKLRKSITEFLLLQFGMCIFKWDEDNSKYTQQAFNFYVFPKPFSRQSTDKRFMCQSSSIDFLASQGFDFNKVFRQGIPYLLTSEEEKLRSYLVEKHRQIGEKRSSPAFTSPYPAGATSLSKGPPVIPEDKKEFLNDVCHKISEFLKTDKDELKLPPFNPYLRKLVYQITEMKFQQQVVVDTRTDEKRMRYQVVVRVRSEADMRDKEEKKQQQEYTELDEALGFTKVIQHLSQSGKLVVGHNMLMDLLYTISQFLFVLPEDYEDFKSLVHNVFPRLIDTKLISLNEPFSEHVLNTTLALLVNRLDDPPFKDHRPVVECAENFPGYSRTSEKLHEAGYDAYLTGLSYAAMLQYCKGNLSIHENRIFLMRLYDVPYMNLKGKDVMPDRSHVFHINFPVTWKTQDLQMLFSPFGNINISWIDDTSAFISLYTKEAAPSVPVQLKCNDTYQVITYKQYRQQLDARKTPSPPPYKAQSRGNVVTPRVFIRGASKDGLNTPVSSQAAGQKRKVLVPEEPTTNQIAGQKRKVQVLEEKVEIPEKRLAQESNSSSSGAGTPMSEENSCLLAKKPATEDIGVVVPRNQKCASVPDVAPTSQDFPVPESW